MNDNFFFNFSEATKLVTILSEWIFREESLALTRNALMEPTLYSLDQKNRRRFPVSPAYDVLLTLVNPDPERVKVNYDLEQAAGGMRLFFILLQFLYFYQTGSQEFRD